MKNKTLTIIAFLVTGTLFAQDPANVDTLWKVSGVTSLNLSQLSLSNWAAGGENSLSGNVLFKISPDYDNGSLSWDNDLTLGFGLVKQGNDPSRKSDDQINLSSKVGYKASKNWSYSGLVSFKTQFAEGYDDPGADNRLKISNLMAPAYLNISAGMDYKPIEGFSMFISPLTGKVTFVLDEDLSTLGAFGVPAGEKVRGEFGGYIKLAYKKEILKNVTLDTRIDLFTNYLENPQYVDVNWDLLLTFKVNEYISASLITQLIYDHDIKFGPGLDEARVQFKELFGLGLSYSF
ncbi:MAG: DUF3078 domain-containing protein [Bacteroidota bacterium]